MKVVVTLRRLLRSGFPYLLLLVVCCSFSLVLVMRGPLSKLTTASLSTDTHPSMATAPAIPHNTDSGLFDVEGVILKNYRADCGHNVAVPELVGKVLLRGQDRPASAPASRSDSQYVHEEQLPPKRRIAPNSAMVSMDFVIDRFNVLVDDKHVITKAYWG